MTSDWKDIVLRGYKKKSTERGTNVDAANVIISGLGPSLNAWFCQIIVHLNFIFLQYPKILHCSGIIPTYIQRLRAGPECHNFGPGTKSECLVMSNYYSPQGFRHFIFLQYPKILHCSGIISTYIQRVRAGPAIGPEFDYLGPKIEFEYLLVFNFDRS